MAAYPPMSGSRSPRATLKIQGQARQQDHPIEYLVVSNGFFQALSIPVLRGRDFNHGDIQEAEWVAVLNESAARRYWPDSDPMGQYLTLDVQGTSQNRRVIGVVRDFRYGRLNEPPGPAAYVSHLQQPLIFRSTSWISQVSRTFLFRLAVPPEQVLPGMRSTVARLTGNQPIFQVHTVEEMQGELFRAPRFTITLLGAFAAFGLILAAAGTFGVTSYSVIQRSREIGLRMALGAHRADVVRMILGEGLLIGGIGIALGMAGAAAATRVLKAHLYEIEPADPATFALVALLMLLVVVSACYVPVTASRSSPASRGTPARVAEKST